MKRLMTLGFFLSVAGCAQSDVLHLSFGHAYNDIFAAQAANHQSTNIAGLNGTECKKIMGSYYESLVQDKKDKPGAGSGSGGIFLRGQ